MDNFTISIFGSKIFLEIINEVKLFSKFKIKYYENLDLCVKDAEKETQLVVFFVNESNKNFVNRFFNYLEIGFSHIIPKGLDHIIFVLGIFLLSTNWKIMLIQVTCFTIAHTITLALSIFEIFILPGRIVEPLIALSIVYIGIENIFTERLRMWRPILVFLFGLLHGLGFARALIELGIPMGYYLESLVAFNLGIEAGQILVIGIAYFIFFIKFSN